jgi:hypothetical protein
MIRTYCFTSSLSVVLKKLYFLAARDGDVGLGRLREPYHADCLFIYLGSSSDLISSEGLFVLDVLWIRRSEAFAELGLRVADLGWVGTVWDV